MNRSYDAGCATLALAAVQSAQSAQERHPDAVPGLFTRALQTLRVWRERSRMRAELAQFDAHLLDDIGLTLRQVAAESDKPFWRA
jgi:uncharacterized protein YjiS (DUF1127 family)